MRPRSTSAVRRARLFRNGSNQAVRIPKELELPGEEVLIRAEKDRLVLEPVPVGKGLLKLLARWKPLAEDFPDIDEGQGSDGEITL
jgi:antitoxin VapB